MHTHLDSGLILRSLSEGVASDRERLPDFLAEVEAEGEAEIYKEHIRRWTRLLLDGHPTTTADDIFVVVDPAKDDALVSATLLIPQTWRYEDVDIAVGRPELVATHPDYRNRGLVRTLFEVIHARSAALGHHMQVITGIPHFYRKFGYTMAIDLGVRGALPLANRPTPENWTPTYTLRPATADDAPDVARFSAYFARERVLTEHYPPDILRYDIAGRVANTFPGSIYLMVIDASGQSVGFLTLSTWSNTKYLLGLTGYVIGEDASYAATFPDVMQGLKSWATTTYGVCPPMLKIGMGLHDALYMLVDKTRSAAISPRAEYAWYVRVPDTVGFLKHIAPVLERRLEGSGANKYSGTLRIGFYDQTGIVLTLERGRLTGVESVSGSDGYHAQFPWEMFWLVVFGHRTAEEIAAILPEVSVWSTAAVLLAALFPRKASWVTGLM